MKKLKMVAQQMVHRFLMDILQVLQLHAHVNIKLENSLLGAVIKFSVIHSKHALVWNGHWWNFSKISVL